MFNVVGRASKIVYATAATLWAAKRARERVAKKQFVMEDYFLIVPICPRCKRRCPCYKTKERS